ncbi:MAG: flagellar biosynthetic protein FliR [Bacillota bacterium]
MDLTQLVLNRMDTYLLVLARTSGIFAIAPFLGSRYIPATVRAALALLISLLLLPMVPVSKAGAGDLLGYATVLLTEAAIGLVIGYASLLILVGVQVAGQILDLDMGFSIVNVVDPHLNLESPLIGNFQYLLGLLFFLTVDGHYWLFAALSQSFKALPLGAAGFLGSGLAAQGSTVGQTLATGLVDLFAQMFMVAVKLALPILAGLFLTTVALGIIARTVPQLNVFVIGLPVKTLVGTTLLAVILPLYVFTLDSALGRMYTTFFGVIGALR